jgi:bifunctional DNA-binding transcriptional regulator/antitoxin component of YhaV-PrlF toxin-antitoxin module
MFQKAITMTSKGTFTLPAKVRRELDLGKGNEKLMLTFHHQSGTIEIRKAPDLHELRTKIAKLLPKDMPPFDLQAIRAQKHKDHLA